MRFMPLATAALLLSSCGSFRGLERDLEELDDLCRARVSVENLSGRQSPNVVLLVNKESKQLASVGIQNGSGETVLRVPLGSYFLAVYEDRNENLRRDDDEPVRFHGAPTPIQFEQQGQALSFALELSDADLQLNARERELISQIRSANPEIEINNLGRVAALTEDTFAPEFGEQGMWEPAEFLADRRHGIYMLEEYDPRRTPIVFVHGVGGTPRDFSGMIESIDHSKFQAWVFYYPSALRLADLGNYLFQSLQLKLANLEVQRFMLVAHSMGGLVSTEALQQAAEAQALDHLALFVTIASPLGGMPSAQMGVDWSPTVMPCWYDLAPGSPFLGKLYRADTSAVPYDLIFAYERDGWGGESSDGTVPLHSQLRNEAQDRARDVHGVNSDHVGVLSHADTLEWINARFAKIATN